MLAHPTHERLIALGLTGMDKAFEDQRRSQDIAALSFEERLGLVVDREAAECDTKRVATRLKFAALRQNAVVEDIDLRAPRGIDRALFQKLIAGDWINRAEGLLITGPTGVGRLFEALALARGDGRHARLLKTLARVQLLILDDWGLAKFTEAEQRDLLEILEDRHQRASILITSQVPVEQRHEIIGNPTLADAILDRLVHNAHRIQIKGESMRKNAAGKRVRWRGMTAHDAWIAQGGHGRTPIGQNYLTECSPGVTYWVTDYKGQSHLYPQETRETGEIRGRDRRLPWEHD